MGSPAVLLVAAEVNEGDGTVRLLDYLSPTLVVLPCLRDDLLALLYAYVYAYAYASCCVVQCVCE